MTTITEDYVSFEVAKLLKEKGFDVYGDGSFGSEIKIWMEYSPFGKIRDVSSSRPSIKGYPAPTLQMAMKWLREVHNIFICIVPSEVGAGVMDYTYILYKIDANNFYFEDLDIQGRAENISKISYEKTVEAAIKYCLENLI